MPRGTVVHTAGRSRGTAAVVAAAVLIAVAWGTVAVAQISTAEIQVYVVDEGNQPLPGVTVQVAQPAIGLNRTVVTGMDGMARVAALPPGSYTIKFELAGFNPLDEQVVLRIGQIARINATMAQAKAEQITVTAAAPVVDVLKMDSSSNIVPEQIADLPVPDRQFENLAFIAPGVQRERGDFRFIKGGPVIGAGGNASYATILVDGVDFTDPALGLARARFSQDAIREFRVINNRFDTEIGGSAGGALSVVTKSGTNLYSGDAFAFYRSDGLRSKGALERESLPYDRGQYGFTLGGPIVKDKTYFFFSGEYIKTDDITLYRPKGAFLSQQADIKHPWDQTLLFGSLDHSFSDAQRLSAKLVYDKYREDNFRVGGVADVSYGQQLNRDNWNFALQHVLVPSENYVNELHLQIGSSKYQEPPNSIRMAEWFSSGNTLQTGTNILGDLLGKDEQWELRDTAHMYAGAHDIKMGIDYQHIKYRSRIDTFQEGLMLYVTDTRALPLAYSYGVGSSDVTTSTNLWAGFVQDDWHVKPNLTLSLGLRYDLDTNGNDPDFHHPLVPNGRSRDTNNYQPRVGFSWDLRGDGKAVMRGGWGRFTGRFLLIPALTELQQNGVTGRVTYTNINGALYWPLCPSLGITDPTVCQLVFPALDPNNPAHTGMPSPPSITLLDKRFVNPQADQATLGIAVRLGANLFFDTEAQYVKGTDEIVVGDKNWSGNATHTRPNPAYTQINVYTNQGRSEYKALVFSLNGTLKGGHLLTASVTIADKKNISDDFSPEFPYGYPNDPANIGAEYGRSRTDERYHIVLSGVFRLPLDFTVAPVIEYGSGQPWTQRYGYDYNGDGKNSDRLPGVERNSMDGPRYSSVNLRVTKAFPFGGGPRLELIAEAFNLFNTVNYQVASVDGARYLNGPTITNPTTAYVVNPNYGRYSATFPAREIQLGLRLTF
ncbi:MAG: TonB-dependent receptor [Acidobacteriota bacterium]